jgi:DNA-binding SARP family transcriptional activator
LCARGACSQPAIDLRVRYSASVRFWVLGPLTVTKAGRPLALGGPKERTVLAHLLANADQVVPVDALIGSLWGDAPPRTAVKSLQIYVLRLRNALEPDRSANQFVLTRGTGYQLRLTGHELDSRDFEHLVKAGRHQHAAGEYHAAAATLRDALDLWRGTAYAGFEHTQFGAAEAAKLAELRLTALEDRIDADLALGTHRTLVAELTALVATHPLRERLWSQLMLALYRCGRQAESLVAYQRVRGLFDTELGIEPGPELRQRHAAVLRHDPDLDWFEPSPARTPRLDAAHAVVSPQVAGLTPIIGRQRELDALRASFLAGDPHPAATPTVRVLSGMGGVGKTSLARAFSQQHHTDYGVVWWVRAEDPAAIDTEFRGLLEQLIPPEDAAQVRDARTAVFTLLAHREDPWLLVLDNIPNAAATQTLLPPAGCGHVLITTQASNWPNPDAVLPVQPLGRAAAVELLTSLSVDDDQPSAQALAAELAGLPLALAQAAAFVRANAIDLATYLRLYRARSGELHHESRLADYPHTVATTWQLALDRLTATGRALLNLLAFYASDAIPIQLLLTSSHPNIPLPSALDPVLRPLLSDELAKHRAVGNLLEYNLITCGDTAGSAVSVHRLIQAVTRDHLRASGTVTEWLAVAHALITAALPERWVTIIPMATWNVLHTHVRALLDHLPPDYTDTLITRYQLAYWTGNAGDAVGARDMFTALHRVQERVLGADHPDTLATRHQVAGWTGEAGDPTRARELFAALLPTQQRVLGARHLDTLRTRHRLADFTGITGDAATARDMFVTLLPVQEDVLGVEHIDTIATRRDVAAWTGETGDAPGAVAALSALVPILERVLGPEHPQTLRTRHELAYWTGIAGDPAGARAILAALLPVRQRILGEQHPRTLATRHELARWTGEAGDPTTARDAFAAILPIYEHIRGPHHPDTLATRHQLALWSGKSGNASIARDILTALLPIQEKVLGTDHPATTTTRHDLDSWTKKSQLANVRQNGTPKPLP